MRIITITCICLGIMLQANAQETFQGAFTAGPVILNNPTYEIALNDAMGKTVLLFNKNGITFDNKYYYFAHGKNSIMLVNSQTKVSAGLLKNNLRSFNVDGINYKISKRNRKGCNFAIIDKTNHQISLVKYSKNNNEYSVEIRITGNVAILPYVFLVAFAEVNNYNESLKLLNFLILTSN